MLPHTVRPLYLTNGDIPSNSDGVNSFSVQASDMNVHVKNEALATPKNNANQNIDDSSSVQSRGNQGIVCNDPVLQPPNKRDTAIYDDTDEENTGLSVPRQDGYY